MLWSACTPTSATEGDAADSEAGEEIGVFLFDSGPDPDLDGTSPDSSLPEDSTSDGDSADMDSSDAASPPPFSEIASLVATKCAQSNCHGKPPAMAQEFLLGSNDPSESKIQSVLEGTTIDMPTAPLVEPGEPKESGLYQSLIPLENRTKMPLGDSLPEEEIELVRTWIKEGAPYD